MSWFEGYRFTAVHFLVLAALLSVLSASALCSATRQSPAELIRRLGTALNGEPQAVGNSGNATVVAVDQRSGVVDP